MKRRTFLQCTAAIGAAALFTPRSLLAATDQGLNALPALSKTFVRPSPEYWPHIRYVIPEGFDAGSETYLKMLEDDLMDHYDKGYSAYELEAWKVGECGDVYNKVLKTLYPVANKLGMRLDLRIFNDGRILLLSNEKTPSVGPEAHEKHLEGTSTEGLAGGFQLRPGYIFPAAKEAGPVFVAVLAVRVEEADGERYQKEVIQIKDVTYANGVCSYAGPSMTIGLPGQTWDIIAYYYHVGWEIDFYSVKGARAVIERYESLWDDEIKTLLKKNGGYFTSDGGDGNQRSTIVIWSDTLPDAFHKQKGYDIIDYLAVQYSGYKLEGDGAERIYNDWISVLSSLFCKFNETIEDWAQRKYNSKYRAQVGYSTRLDTQKVAQSVGQIDVESLWSADVADSYISMSSVGNITRKPVLGNEIGARSPAFNFKWRKLVSQINISLAGGVTRMYYHVRSFQYNPTSTWPGYTAWSPMLADWGPTTPQYIDTKLINDYVARAQYVMRAGVAVRDLAVYMHNYTDFDFNLDPSLREAGYTWDTLSPALMETDAAKKAKAGVIDPEGGRYRAFVIAHTLNKFNSGFTDKARFETKAWETVPVGATGGQDNAPENDPTDGPGPAPEENPIAGSEAPPDEGFGMRREVISLEKLRGEVARMPVSTARIVLSYARAGVPIVVVGQIPTRTEGYSETANGRDDGVELAEIFDAIRATGNLTQVASEAELPGALRRLGVRPNADNIKDSAITSYLRRTADGTHYYFLYNSDESPGTSGNNYTKQLSDEDLDRYKIHLSTDYVGKAVSQTISLKGAGRPYRMDPWTGVIEAIADYSTKDGYINLNVALESGETAIIAITNSATGPLHAVELSGEFPCVYDAKGKLTLRAAKEGQYAVKLSDGVSRTVSVRGVANPVRLDSGWTLSVESWTPANPVGATGIEGAATKKTLLPEVKMSKLVPWGQIEGIGKTVSGIGTYNAKFTLDGRFDGALLSLGKAFDLVRVYINDTEVAVNQSTMTTDLGKNVVKGENTLRVESSTSPYNAIRAAGLYKSSRMSPIKVESEDYGLLGPVIVTPYVQEEVGAATSAG